MKCIIVDDEPIARRGMERLVASREELELTGVFDSADAAESFLKDNEVDLIFLDIEMPGSSGIELAKKTAPNHLIIFTTAYSDYAIESYETYATGYLLKPIDPTRFNKAVDKSLTYSRLCQTEEMPTVVRDYFIVKSDRRYVRIKFDDITYVESLKDYLIIHTDNRRVITRMTVKSIEGILPSDRFVRVNKSYIVNWDKIEAFDSNDLFIGDTEIAIGVSYKESILSKLLDDNG